MKKQDCKGCIHIKKTGNMNPCCICTDYNSQYQSDISDREKALEWWNKKLSGFDRTRIGSKYFCFQRLSSLTGSEIEQIWNKETSEYLKVKIFIGIEFLDNKFKNGINMDDIAKDKTS